MNKIIYFLIVLILFSFTTNALAIEKDELIDGAVSGILIDADSGKIIYQKNINKKVAVASMTKMMAQIIILENIENKKIKWEDEVIVSHNAAEMGGSQIYISEGEKITIEDLMKGISMASGNDATVMMAEVIAGSEGKFVKLMNDKVKELGLKNTQFKNSTGLDEDGHYSSAYDMAIIARELVVNHPEILRFSSVYEDYLRENTANKFWLVNTNKLVRFYEGADGLKTGHTDNAGYCLAATAKRNGLRLIAIVLGEKNATIRNNETMKLLDYGYQNVKIRILKEKGAEVKKIKIDKADQKTISVVLKNDLSVVENVLDNNIKYTYQVDLNNIKLPIKVGNEIGKISVYRDKRKIKDVSLTVSKDVNPLSFFELYWKETIDLISGSY